MTKQTLTCDGLTKHYHDRAVVNDVSLTLSPGKINVLLGASGAGKTTLLRLIAGMERPDSGQIFSGEDVLSSQARHVPIEKRKIGLIFQDFALFPHLNVQRNVMFGLQHLPREDRRHIADQWLEKMSLSHRREAFPHHLSGGEQQRVAIARALAPAPIAILLDEAFSGLDPALRQQTRDAVLTLIRETKTPALLVSHDPFEALAHGDEVAVMSDGRILQAGTPDTLYRQPNSLLVARALGAVQKVDTSAFPPEWQADLGKAGAVYLRPDAFKVDNERGAAVDILSMRPIGAETRIRIGFGGEELDVDIPRRDAPQSGDTLKLTIDSDCVFSFASPQS